MIGSHWGHLGARGPALGARETRFKTPGPATARVDGSGGGSTGREDQVRAGGAAGLAGPNREGRRSGEVEGPPPLLWSCSPVPARRIESLLGARDLAEQTDRLRRNRSRGGEGQRDTVRER